MLIALYSPISLAISAMNPQWVYDFPSLPPPPPMPFAGSSTGPGLGYSFRIWYYTFLCHSPMPLPFVHLHLCLLCCLRSDWYRKFIYILTVYFSCWCCFSFWQLTGYNDSSPCYALTRAMSAPYVQKQRFQIYTQRFRGSTVVLSTQAAYN